MKILSYRHSEILLKPIDQRSFLMGNAGWVVLRTDIGDLEIRWEKGTWLNARSGPIIADYFIPHMGNQKTLACWVVHDFLGYDYGISFKTINDNLDQMLELAGHSDFKSDVVEFAVGLTDDWFGTHSEIEEKNRQKICAQYVHKSRLPHSKSDTTDEQLPQVPKDPPGIFRRFFNWFRN